MMLLSDGEIAQRLQSTPPILTDFIKPHDWDAKESLVQPSSLDLHVGNIFVPPKDEPKVGEAVDKRDKDYTLQPGQAAIVNTLETLNFPNNIAAFGFPPTSIADRAVLMTNPGHIDPGFKGKLSFTLINMGREPFIIAKGKTIVTLLLVSLATPARKGYQDRDPSFTTIDPSALDLYRLGRDFLDLDQRARKAAETFMREENIRSRRREMWFPVMTALISAIVAFGAAWLQSKQTIAELNQKITEIQTQQKFQDRLENIETKVKDLTGSSNKQSQPGSTQTK